MPLKHRVLSYARRLGLFRLARLATARKIRILAYHGIWLGDGHFGNFLYMSPDKFARRMALLAEWGYPVVALDAATAANGRGTLPKLATVITIDDGWYGTWSKMLPELEHHGYPATLYLTTYYCLSQAPVVDVALQYCFHAGVADAIHLDGYGFGPFAMGTEAERQHALGAALDRVASLANDGERQAFLQALCAAAGIDWHRMSAERWFHLMTAEEVADAGRRGIHFELHTHHHRISHRGQDCLAEELAVNRDHITRLTGRSPRHFCYPSGRFTSAVWPTLERCNIASATTTDIGLTDDRLPIYALPRILDGQDVSELEFEAEMSGFMELGRRLRGACRRWFTGGGSASAGGS
ncbi:MAG: polysaccharide deacetylase family protein [Porticoccaceae bacterium]